MQILGNFKHKNFNLSTRRSKGCVDEVDSKVHVHWTNVVNDVWHEVHSLKIIWLINSYLESSVGMTLYTHNSEFCMIVMEFLENFLRIDPNESWFKIDVG